MTGICSIISCMVCIISLTIQSSDGAYPFFGGCPQRPVKGDFDTNKYSGIWYEIESYYSMTETTNSCPTLFYQVEDDQLIFVQKSYNKGSKRNDKRVGTIKFGSKSKNGRLEITYSPSGKRKSAVVVAPHWILDTDYDNYRIVWECKNAEILNFQNIRFLSRDREPTNYVRVLVYGVVQSQGLSTRVLFKTDQSDCPDLFVKKMVQKHKKGRPSLKINAPSPHAHNSSYSNFSSK